MLIVFQKDNREKLHNLVTLMLPLLGTQMATMGMGFFDATMSGQAGNIDLAGAAIGSNIWAPIHTGLGGVLMAATPLIANALGAGDRPKISAILYHGLLLAVLFGMLVLSTGGFWLPMVLNSMGLEPAVYKISLYYCFGVAIGIIPFFLTILLRALIDTFGHTDLTLKLYLLGLPINACLNYILIFGKLGLPRLGGIGAGVATGLTYWLLFLLFAVTVCKIDKFKEYFLNPNKENSQRFSMLHIKEYLRVGIPMGCSIFLEVTIFCVVAFFMAKFGTDTIAAHQAAMNMACLVYMIPLSFSMALTIVIGIEYGGKRFEQARIYGRLGTELSVLIAFVYLVLEFIFRDFISQVYSSDANVQQLLQQFIIYAIVWQCGDAIGSPIQGALRGYKDVEATFWSNMLAFWGICLPLGLLLDFKFNMGPFAYWQSLAFGVLCSATILILRLKVIQKRIARGGVIN